MNISLHSMTVATSPRHKPYRFIHKALRAAMTSASERLGRADGGDLPGLLSALSELEELLALCEGHLRHEQDFIHAALRERDSQAVDPFDQEHSQQREAAAALRRGIAAVRAADSSRREAAMYALFLDLSLYIAQQWQHMAEEETVLTQALWAQFSDAEIEAIETALVASIPAEERQAISSWMLYALNHDERLVLLRGMRTAMPASAFETLLESNRTRIGQSGWLRLQHDLQRAPAPACAD